MYKRFKGYILEPKSLLYPCSPCSLPLPGGNHCDQFLVYPSRSTRYYTYVGKYMYITYVASVTLPTNSK